MRKKELHTKLLSFALSAVLVCTMLPATVFAVNPTVSKIFVNGIDITQEQDTTITFSNEGTAVYDEITNTITLTNAQITQGNADWVGIHDNSGMSRSLNVVLHGENSIGGTKISDGILAKKDINISGDGSLSIEVTTSGGSFTGPIISNGGTVTIKDVQLTLKDVDRKSDYSAGIRGYTTSSTDYLVIDNAKISMDGFAFGITTRTIVGTSLCGVKIINGSRVTMTNVVRGIMTNWNNSSPVGPKLFIDNSTVRIDSSKNGIYTQFIHMTNNADVSVNISGNSDVGIMAYEKGDFSIVDSKLTLSANGELALQSPDKFTVSGSTVNVTQNGAAASAIEIAGDVLFEKKAKITVNLTNTQGWNCLQLGKKLTIHDSELFASSPTAYAALYAEGDISIEGDSTVNIDASASTGIYGEANVFISDTATVTAEGSRHALFTEGNFTLSGGSLDATSVIDVAIFSRGVIDLANGTIHADGGSWSPAIATEIIDTGGDTAIFGITLTNLIEKKAAITAFTPFMDFDGHATSWTSFITQADSSLKTDSNGYPSNALKEVWLAPPHTVTFNLNGGEGATPEDQKIYPGNKAQKPTNPLKTNFVFKGWSDNLAIFNITNTSVTKDLNLTAQWQIPGPTPNPDPTPGHSHIFGINWVADSTSHWQECTTNDGAISGEAAHTPGEAATIDYPQNCTICGYEIAPKLPSENVIVDASTDAAAEYEDGSKFDDTIELVVTPQDAEKIDSHKEIVDNFVKGSFIAGLYDVKLLKNGVAIQPNGKIKVSLKLTDEMKAMTNLQLIYIDDNSNVTLMPSEIKDDKIIFITDHLSYYGVIGTVKAVSPTPDSSNGNSPQTSDTSNIILWIALLFVSAGGIFALSPKRKRLAK